MHAVDPVSLIYQSKAKSCIQALLKTRNKQHQIRSRDLRKYSLRSIHNLRGGFAVGSQDTSFDNQHSEYTQQDSPPENVDNSNDFNYSQKLFHIADGNLYSIFSPIQGRSCGMKPSFLRKQKYTVQECHSRGRKNLRKGLKFHNFLPSESVTSEKDNGFLKSKWKIHSECRLREEHGTKQITISNWSQSVHNSSEDSSTKKSHSTLLKSDNSSNQSVSYADNEYRVQVKQKPSDSDPYDFKINLERVPPQRVKPSSATESREQDSVKSESPKKSTLKCVLDSLLDKPFSPENQNYYLQDNKSNQNQKHRRKPVQTRRVVPYTKYLSILEEDESSPLDLSSKCSGDKSSSPLSFDEEPFTNSGASNCDGVLVNDRHKISTKDNFNLESMSNSKLNLISYNRTTDNFVDSPVTTNLLQNHLTSPLVLVPSSIGNNTNLGQFPNDNKISLETSNGKPNFNFHMNHIKIMNSSSPLHLNPGSSFSGNMQYGVQKSFIKNSQTKIRRRSQRSVIKKNLEDTFRQNGFLVKTKQVSDGEATFCKFRQLRKYTRYYLKSWQQHLPDEVHKMWKGFLPPKTVLPPVTGQIDAANEKD